MVERYQPNGIPLTPRELEIIQQLAEEASEVTHAALKVLRFGKEDTNQVTGESNSYVMGKEVGNLLAIINLAAGDNLILKADVEAGEEEKLERLAKYTKHLP